MIIYQVQFLVLRFFFNKVALILRKIYKLVLSHLLRSFLFQIRGGGKKRGEEEQLLCMEKRYQKQCRAALQYNTKEELNDK